MKRLSAFFAAIAVALVGSTSVLTAYAAGSNGTITVTKVDENGAPLAGATMQLLDERNTVVREWTTDADGEEVIDGLAYPATYTVREVSAPQGYALAADRKVRLASPAGSDTSLAGGQVSVGNGTGFSYGMAVNGTVVYCLNRFTLIAGPTAQGDAIPLSSVTDSSFNAAQAAAPNEQAHQKYNGTFQVAQNKDKILGALLVGYPNDLAGIGAKYNLSERAFNQVTQDLIWYYANGLEPGVFDTSWDDKNFHQSPEFNVWWNALKSAAETIDTSEYDATVYGASTTGQPVVGTNVVTPSGQAPTASVTIVDEKLTGTVEVMVKKVWKDADSTADLSATFQVKNAQGEPVGAAVTLTNSTGWEYTFKGLPASGAPYTVEEVATTEGWVQDSVEHTTTPVESTRTEQSTAWEAVAPEIGKTYAIAFLSNNGSEHVVATMEQNGNDAVPHYGAGVLGQDIPRNQKWTLVKDSEGIFGLQSAETGKYWIWENIGGNAQNEIGLMLAGPTEGLLARFYLHHLGDNYYELRTDYNLWGQSRTLVFRMSDTGAVLIPIDNRPGTGNYTDWNTTLRFYEQVTRNVTSTVVTPVETYVFTNKKGAPKPKIGTTATDAADNDTTVAVSATAQVKDVISFENLTVGKTYTVSGELHKKNADGTDGGPIAATSVELTDAEGATVVDASGCSFTATSTSGTVTVVFTIDTTKLAGKKLVAFEKVLEDGAEVAAHADINAPEQTVEVDNPKTSVKATKVWKDGDQTVNAPEGASVTFQLKANGQNVGDAKELVFGPNTSSRTVEWKDLPQFDENGEIAYTVVETAFSAEGFTKGKITGNAKDGFVLTNTKSPAPEIGTTATDVADGDKVINPGATQQVKDVVKYTNLSAGKTYTLEGRLVKKSDSEPYETVATASTTFTPTEANGTVTLVFDVDASALAGEVLVAFETVKYEGVEVVVHANINDIAQTVVVEKPEVEISKIDAATSQELPGAELTITKKGTDEVVESWTSTDASHKVKLAPGEYTLTETTAPDGYLVAESIDFTVDENGLVGGDKVVMEDQPKPTPKPSEKPSVTPSATPSVTPSETPSETPSVKPSETPSVKPSEKPSASPSETPTVKPVVESDVEISKVDAATGEELPGAELTITKKGTDEVVESWTSTDTPHMVKLAPGEYTLTEVQAPEWYELAESIDFTVDENGLVGSEKVVMKDERSMAWKDAQKTRDNDLDKKSDDLKKKDVDLPKKEVEGNKPSSINVRDTNVKPVQTMPVQTTPLETTVLSRTGASTAIALIAAMVMLSAGGVLLHLRRREQ